MQTADLPLDQDFLDDCRDIPDVLGDTSAVAAAATSEAAQPVQPSSMLTSETLAATFETMFGFIADMRGEGAEFWQLKPMESKNLGQAWLPVVGPLLDAWGASQHGALIFAVGMTGITLGPRLARDTKLRASRMANTAMEKFSASPSSPVQPAAASPSSPTVSLEVEDEL